MRSLAGLLYELLETVTVLKEILAWGGDRDRIHTVFVTQGREISVVKYIGDCKKGVIRSSVRI